MANQPKKYKKFVATAATATLVASAIVPVASAAHTDTAGHQFESYINEATKLGLFNDGGEFKPGNKLTRKHVVLILGRYLEDAGKKPAADYETNPAFTDLGTADAEYIRLASVVKEAGIFHGDNGKINGGQNISRQHMAKVLDGLAEAVAGTSLVDAAAEIEDKKVTDLEEAGAAYRAQIQALADFGITTVEKFNPKGEVTRGQFAKFIIETINAIKTIGDDKEEYGTVAEEVKAVEEAVKALPATVTKENAEDAQKAVDAVAKAVKELEDAIKATELSAEDKTAAEKAVADAKAEVSKTQAAIDALEKDTTPGELTVESVSAINSQKEPVALNELTINGSIVLEFSEAVDKETVNINNIRLFTKEGNVPVTLSSTDLSVSKDGKTVVVNLPYVEYGTEYYVVAKNIKADASDSKIAEKKVELKTSSVVVVTSVTKVDTVTNLDAVKVTFDKDLDPTTVNNTNVYLINTVTGAKVPVNVTYTGKVATLTLSTPYTSTAAAKFQVVTENLKSNVGGAVENYKSYVVVNDATPLTGTETYKTLDGKVLGSNDLWGKLTAGTHVNATGVDYHAGLEIQVQVEERLDAESVAEYVRLFNVDTEKEVAAKVTYNTAARIITIVPTADLAEGTEFEVQFFGGLKTELGTYLNYAKSNEAIVKKSFDTLDLTAASVVSVTSKNGESNLKVSENQDFVIEFSESVALTKDNLLVASTDFKVADSTTYGNVIADVDITLTAVTGSNNKKWTVRIAKDELSVNKTYQIAILGKDSTDTLKTIPTFSGKLPIFDGATPANFLARTSNFAFTTEGADVTAPKLVSTYKATATTLAATEKAGATVTSGNVKNVISGNVLSFKFDEGVEYVGAPASSHDAKTAYIQFKNASGKWDSAVIYINPAEANSNVETTKQLLLNVTLPAGLVDAEYRVVFPAGSITDQVSPTANATLKDLTFEFTGSVNDETVSSIKVVELTKNASGQYNALSSAAANEENTTFAKTGVLVDLADNDIKSVTADQIKVTDKDGNVVAGTVVTVDSDNATSEAGKFLFVPSEDLKASTTYTVTVDGIKDEVGNQVAKSVKQFKTQIGALQLASTTVENNSQAVDREKSITIKLNRAVKSGETAKVTLTNADTEVDFDEKSITVGKDSATFAFGTAVGEKLAPNTNYEITVDLPGTDNDKVIKFTTGTVATDSTAPKLSKFEGATYSATTNPVITSAGSNVLDFVFSEEIASVGSATVALLGGTATDPQPVVITKAIDTSDKTNYSVTLNTTLGNNKFFEVVLKDVKDSAGNVTSEIKFIVNVNDDAVALATANADITAGKSALATPTIATGGADLGSLPSTGANGTTIAWESSDEDTLTDAGVGVAGKAGTVQLTATISKTVSGQTGTPQTKVFAVTVDVAGIITAIAPQ